MNILEVKDLSIQFKTRNGMVNAVRGVNFWLERGEILGVAGESGCGKTTTALAVPRLLSDNAVITGGTINFEGKDLASLSEKEMQDIRWKQISVIFQGAMNALNPLTTIGHQISEPILLHEPGVSKKEAEERAKLLLEEVGIAASRYTNYPHEFSGGMRQRVMMAMSLACNPQLVIADEPVTALDVMIQAQIMDLIRKLKEEHNLSMIMISHDLSVLSELCDKIAIMYAGKVVEFGSAKEVFSNPKHPYTMRLMKSYPNIYGEKTFVNGIPGYPPNLINLEAGCLFCDRCEEHIAACKSEEPELVDIGGGHYCACICSR